jgi:uncharacterized NAD-dependent epimerase/dehydratase family protein
MTTQSKLPPDSSSQASSARRPRQEQPRWRTVFNSVEAGATPKVEALVRSEGFARLVSAAVSVESAVQKQVRQYMSRYWHVFNLPAASDLTRLSQRIARLERNVAELVEASKQRPPT